MSTQIIDNFKLNSNLPIDSRIVASGSVARNAIVWKYDGLRVYDTSDHIPYVWIGSTASGTWSSENILGVSGTGTASYFATFDSLNVIKSSNIYQLGSFVGINNNIPSYSLDVSGTVYATNLKGDGSLVTNINASNISTGNLSLSRMPPGLPGQILTTNGTIGVYQNPSTITVGTSNISLTSNVFNDTSSTLCNIYFGTQSAGNSVLKYNSNLSYTPSTSQLIINGGSFKINSTYGYTIESTSGNRIFYNGTYPLVIGFISIPSNSTFYIECTFVTRKIDRGQAYPPVTDSQTNKLCSSYSVNNSGVLTQKGVTSLFSVTDTISVSPGTFSVGINILNFVQTVSAGPYGTDVYSHISYKIDLLIH